MSLPPSATCLAVSLSCSLSTGSLPLSTPSLICSSQHGFTSTRWSNKMMDGTRWGKYLMNEARIDPNLMDTHSGSTRRIPALPLNFDIGRHCCSCSFQPGWIFQIFPQINKEQRDVRDYKSLYDLFQLHHHIKSIKRFFFISFIMQDNKHTINCAQLSVVRLSNAQMIDI